MARITGFGGVFFKTDPAATAKWFSEVLELPTESWGRMFPTPSAEGYTVMGLHARDSSYFGRSAREFMLNLQVDDLEGMLAKLKLKGVVPTMRTDDENGKFAHIEGPDGITIELFQP